MNEQRKLESNTSNAIDFEFIQGKSKLTQSTESTSGVYYFIITLFFNFIGFRRYWNYWNRTLRPEGGKKVNPIHRS